MSNPNIGDFYISKMYSYVVVYLNKSQSKNYDGVDVSLQRLIKPFDKFELSYNYFKDNFEKLE